MEKAFEPYVDGSTNTVIKVVGVGGAGGNALNTMVTKLTDCQVEFIAANTDRQALTRSLASEKISLGRTGLGAGARPEVGFQAANDAREEIAEKLRGADMVFITAGMGGGTGTGASPVIAEVAQELGILTVAVVTKPFSFEGGKRMRNAELGLNQLKNRVHSLIVILNDKLEEELGEDATMRECFEKADEVLFNACAGIAELIQKVGQINLDFEDVRTVMGTRGTAMMGSGEAEGPDRAVTAASMAVTCPLLKVLSFAVLRVCWLTLRLRRAFVCPKSVPLWNPSRTTPTAMRLSSSVRFMTTAWATKSALPLSPPVWIRTAPMTPSLKQAS